MPRLGSRVRVPSIPQKKKIRLGDIISKKDGPFVYRLVLKIFILARGVRFPHGLQPAEIAQLVEHNLAKVGVASSSLVFRSFLHKGCSNGGMVDTRDLKSLGHYGCAGSSPASSTRKKNSSAEFSVEEFSFIPLPLPLVVVDVFRFPFVFGRGAFCRIAYGDDVEGDDA